MSSPEVEIYYLEMTSPEQLKPRTAPDTSAEVIRAELPLPELNCWLYESVGQTWQWTDKLTWDKTQWQAWVARPELETYLGYLAGTPFGYFELERQGRDTEISIFGLLPAFIGRGLGGYLLSEAVRRAWHKETRRVWVHTCSLDHPGALKNYQARGFRLYKSEKVHKNLKMQD